MLRVLCIAGNTRAMLTQYDSTSPLKIGTRGSPLALAQAVETRDRLMAAHDMPEAAFAIEVIQTTGDAVQDRPLSEIGGKGLFTKEIELALMDRRIDIAVHSMKDVATRLPDGLVISTVLPREDVRDTFISREFSTLDDLPHGAVFGSSSLRRRAQLLARRPDLKMVEFRGNVQTRLMKLDEGVAVATLLAQAGLRRLGNSDLGTVLETDVLLPAVAQGAIGIEQRAEDESVAALLTPLNDPSTAHCVQAERAFLAALDGSCRTPIAGLAKLTGDRIEFTGEILRPDGSEVLRTSRSGPVSDRARLGRDAGEELKSRSGGTFF